MLRLRTSTRYFVVTKGHKWALYSSVVVGGGRDITSGLWLEGKPCFVVTVRVRTRRVRWVRKVMRVRRVMVRMVRVRVGVRVMVRVRIRVRVRVTDSVTDRARIMVRVRIRVRVRRSLVA